MAVQRLTWAVFQRGRSKKDSVSEGPFSLKTAAESAMTPEQAANQARIKAEIDSARWAAAEAVGKPVTG